MGNQKLRYAMVGGGRDAFIGAVHRRAAAFHGGIELVAGALASDPEKALRSGQDLGLDPSRVHGDWQALLNDNAPSPQRIATPVFLAQGDKDPVIVPAVTHDFARRLCQAQVPVRYDAMAGVDHYTAAVRSAAAAAAWIAGRSLFSAEGSRANADAGWRRAAGRWLGSGGCGKGKILCGEK